MLKNLKNNYFDSCRCQNNRKFYTISEIFINNKIHKPRTSKKSFDLFLARQLACVHRLTTVINGNPITQNRILHTNDMISKSSNSTLVTHTHFVCISPEQLSSIQFTLIRDLLVLRSRPLICPFLPVHFTIIKPHFHE